MAKEWVDTVLYRLINKRYVEHKVTLYTSNIKIDDLKIDDRIKDRIESNSFLIELPDVPVRKMKNEQEKQQFLDSLQKNALFSAGNTEQGKQPNKQKGPIAT